jgi:tetratricopeptide (TPR) repeat protein
MIAQKPAFFKLQLESPGTAAISVCNCNVLGWEPLPVQSGHGLILDLGGPLRLSDPGGADLTPRARKAQGLLALLGTAPGLKRSRTWLQDKLWSDRGPEQGAASLRQCLTEIRTRLGPHVNCLRTEAGWVALDPGFVLVRSAPPPGADVEFLEGLDIRDPEFENWLRDQRLARADAIAEVAVADRAPPRPPEERLSDRPILVVAPGNAARDDLRIFADILAETIGLQVAQAGNARMMDELSSHLDPFAYGVRVQVRVAEIGATLYLQIRLSDFGSGTVLWIGLKELDPRVLHPQEDSPLALLSNQAVAVAVDELGRLAEGARDQDRLALLGYQASRHTLAFDIAEQQAADRLLKQAFELHPMGIFLARRSLLRSHQVYERMPVPLETARAEAIEFAHRALALDPTNATVVATAAKTALNLEGRTQVGMQLARRAVELGATNPLAWETLALADAHSGLKEESHAAALRARHFAAPLPQTFYWDMFCCLTATVAGRYAEAIRFGESARDLAPTFKPPLRYLAALYHHTGAIEAAVEQVRVLKALEPGFSVELFESEDYPVAALRKTPLIAVAKADLS